MDRVLERGRLGQMLPRLGLGEAQTGEHLAELATLRDSIHNSVTAYLYERTKRRPMVLPVIMQV